MALTRAGDTMASPHPTSRIYAIDWLRVLAVLAIFFGHVAVEWHAEVAVKCARSLFTR